MRGRPHHWGWAFAGLSTPIMMGIALAVLLGMKFTIPTKDPFGILLHLFLWIVPLILVAVVLLSWIITGYLRTVGELAKGTGILWGSTLVRIVAPTP